MGEEDGCWGYESQHSCEAQTGVETPLTIFSDSYSDVTISVFRMWVQALGLDGKENSA